MPKNDPRFHSAKDVDAVIERMGLDLLRTAMLEGYARDAGVLENALGYCTDHLRDFSEADGRLVHTASGELAENFFRTTLRNQWPSMYPGEHNRDDAFKAFVLADITACGRVMEQQGEDAFYKLGRTFEGWTKIGDKGKEPEPSKIEAAYTASRIDALEAELAKLKATNVPKPKPTAQNNPWLAKSWNLAAQCRLAKADEAGAARTAKAAGCVLGSTRPNPAYNN